MVQKNLDDQRWLGFELHDGLLQWIVGARMQLEVAVAAETDGAQRKRLRQAMRYVELAIEEGRGVIGFLEEQAAEKPHDFMAMMDQFIQAVRPLAAERQQEIELRQPGRAWPELPQTLLWNLLRIAQQAVRNAVAHAGPAQITVVVGWLNDQHLRMEVTDTGVGFDVACPRATPSSRGHFGLSSIRHRASLIDGQLKICSAPGEGTSVQLTVFYTAPSTGASEQIR